MNTPPETTDWPIIIDRHHRHIRTDTGRTVVPFDVIAGLVCIAALLIGVEATFGITNWVTIPTAILAIGWAIERIDHAGVHHQYHHCNTRPDEGHSEDQA